MNLNEIYDLILSRSADRNDPKVLLTELLQLHNFVYGKLGSVAVKYGGGTHPKHRLTKYHDFFVDNVDSHDSVLDLGCGRGDVTYDVAKKTDGKVVGIEMNHLNLGFARTAYRRDNLFFVNGDIRKELSVEHFDVVIMSNVLEHLGNRVELLKSIVAKTTPKKVLLRVPYFEREWTVAMKKELGVAYFLDSTHKIEYTQPEFFAEMEASGLKIESMKVNWGEIWAVCRLRGSN